MCAFLPPASEHEWVGSHSRLVIGTRNLCRWFRRTGFPWKNPLCHRLAHCCPVGPRQLIISETWRCNLQEDKWTW